MKYLSGGVGRSAFSLTDECPKLPGQRPSSSGLSTHFPDGERAGIRRSDVRRILAIWIKGTVNISLHEDAQRTRGRVYLTHG